MNAKDVASPDGQVSFACNVRYLNNNSVRHFDVIVSEAIVHYRCKILHLTGEAAVSRQA